MKSITEMKVEAIKRMKAMGLSSKCVNAFKNHNEVWMSEGKLGALYEITNEPELCEKLKEFNDDSHLAYHIIHNYMEFGECFSIFYVSNDEEEWIYDNEDLTYGIQIVYVWNKDDEYGSEFGSIGFKSMYGGLVRTA